MKNNEKPGLECQGVTVKAISKIFQNEFSWLKKIKQFTVNFFTLGRYFLTFNALNMYLKILKLILDRNEFLMVPTGTRFEHEFTWSHSNLGITDNEMIFNIKLNLRLAFQFTHTFIPI